MARTKNKQEKLRAHTTYRTKTKHNEQARENTTKKQE